MTRPEMTGDRSDQLKLSKWFKEKLNDSYKYRR